MDRFSEQAATWDDDPAKVERARDVAAAIRRVVPLQAGTRALEIGGGTGLLARALVDDVASVVVTDVAPGMVEVAQAALDDPRYAGWSARLYDIEHDPLPADRYDLVLGLLTLHHMGDVATVVERCASLLQPGGHLALADLDRDHDGAFHATVHDFHGHDGFERTDVARWLEAAGLDDISFTDAGSVAKELPDGSVRDFSMFLATARRPL